MMTGFLFFQVREKSREIAGFFPYVSYPMVLDLPRHIDSATGQPDAG
jgi:hypothetical protein